MTDRAVVQVPTLRTDTRLQWVLVTALSINLLAQSTRFDTPIMVSIWGFVAAAVAVMAIVERRQSKDWTPVRVTESSLWLPDGEGAAVAVDWPDIVGFEFRRRWFLPHVSVEPVDAERVRPAPNRFRRAAALRHGRYQITVALGGNREQRERLRTELATRIRAA